MTTYRVEIVIEVEAETPRDARLAGIAIISEGFEGMVNDDDPRFGSYAVKVLGAKS